MPATGSYHNCSSDPPDTPGGTVKLSCCPSGTVTDNVCPLLTPAGIAICKTCPSGSTGAEAAGIGGSAEGRVPGVDPTNFEELTKLQTPKAPAVGIVQHTGQPPLQAMASVFKFRPFAAKEMLWRKIGGHSGPWRHIVEAVLQLFKVVVSLLHSVGSPGLWHHIHTKGHTLVLRESRCRNANC